jgi:hypothetical protein
MKYKKRFGTLPAPFRAAALISLTVFVIAFLGLVLSSGQRTVIALSLGLLGADAFLLGTILATNYQGSAAAYAGLWEVEAGSLLRVFIRVFGTGLIVVGAAFVAVSAVLAFAPTS